MANVAAPGGLGMLPLLVPIWKTETTFYMHVALSGIHQCKVWTVNKERSTLYQPFNSMGVKCPAFQTSQVAFQTSPVDLLTCRVYWMLFKMRLERPGRGNDIRRGDRVYERHNRVV